MTGRGDSMGEFDAPSGVSSEKMGNEPGAPIVIWGAGAIGGSIGAALVRAKKDVLFVDQDRDHVAAMNQRGLHICGPVMETSVPARASLSEEVDGTYDTVLLCVKAHHTEAAGRQVAEHLSSTGCVVSVQNGLCEFELAKIVGRDRTVGSFVNFGADYLEPGVVHRGNRGAVVVGEMDGRLTSRVRTIYGLFQHFEPDAILTENIFGYLWGKLAYAALLFATAVTNDTIADVLDHERYRPVLTSLAQEVISVAEAKEVKLEGFDGFDPEAFHPEAPERITEKSLDDLVTFNRSSAKQRTGIWRDLAVRKRLTEVDAQIGAVVRHGVEEGVETPLLRQLVEQIHGIENGERALSQGNLDELRETWRRL